MKHQIPYYHPLSDWLLGTTIGNQGYYLMDLKKSYKLPSTNNKLKKVKISMKHQIPYYHPLADWLLGVTIGNQGCLVMDLQWL